MVKEQPFIVFVQDFDITERGAHEPRRRLQDLLWDQPQKEASSQA
jgi:hypothetical protein